MVSSSVYRFMYIPVIALAFSFAVGGYIYHRTIEDSMTNIVSDHMLGLLRDVHHKVEEEKIHFYDLTPSEIDEFLNSLSQSTSGQRFTIIHSSGKVLGDSLLKKHEIRELDNYGLRPEVVLALEKGRGIVKRLNSTSNQDVLHVAVRFEIEDEKHEQLFKETHDHDNTTQGDHDFEHDEHDDSHKSHIEHEEHEEHDSVYVVRLAMPMTSVHMKAQNLKLIVYLLMIFSMATLLTSLWYSFRKITQAVNSQKQQQEERIDKSTKGVELLHQLANLLAACKTIGEAKSVVTDIIPRILADSSGCVSIMRESQNLLKVEMLWGDDWPAATSFAPHDCWALRKGKFHISPDEDHNLSCTHLNEVSSKNTTMCIPLTAHGNTVGLFHLFFSGTTPVPKDTKKLALTLAEHLGLAFANLRLQEKLRSRSLRDPLTGLYNRRHFETHLEREWSIAQQNREPLSILMLDLDHFKRFNDNFGHDAGDFVLKEVANLLLLSIDGRSIVSRLGGEEFALICPNTSEEQSMTLAANIIEGVRNLHLEIKGLSLGQLGISAGVSTYPDVDVPDKELVKLADTALYKAKDLGRSQAVHTNHV